MLRRVGLVSGGSHGTYPIVGRGWFDVWHRSTIRIRILTASIATPVTSSTRRGAQVTLLDSGVGRAWMPSRAAWRRRFRGLAFGHVSLGPLRRGTDIVPTVSPSIA